MVDLENRSKCRVYEQEDHVLIYLSLNAFEMFKALYRQLERRYVFFRD